MAEEKTKEEKEVRRKEILKWLDEFDDLVPCKFCGRIVLAGYCCQAALEYWSKHKDDGCSK